MNPPDLRTMEHFNKPKLNLTTFRQQLAGWMKRQPGWLQAILGWLSIPLWPVGLVLTLILWTFLVIGEAIWSADASVVEPPSQETRSSATETPPT